MKRFITGVLVGATIATAGVASAAGGGGSSAQWSRFDRREPEPSRITTIHVWGRCLDAEDSAAHLRLRRYGNDEAWFGCYRAGY
jgi:hypothetical protein